MPQDKIRPLNRPRQQVYFLYECVGDEKQLAKRKGPGFVTKTWAFSFSFESMVNLSFS